MNGNIIRRGTDRLGFYHLIIVVAVAIFSYQLVSMWPHTVDDAYISLRYAGSWPFEEGEFVFRLALLNNSRNSILGCRRASHVFVYAFIPGVTLFGFARE